MQDISIHSKKGIKYLFVLIQIHAPDKRPCPLGNYAKIKFVASQVRSLVWIRVIRVIVCTTGTD
jgi:hypothetical protein